MKSLTVTNGGGAVSGVRGVPFRAGGVGVEGLYSSKSSLDSPLSWLWVSRSLALIDKLKPAETRGDQLGGRPPKSTRAAGADLPAFLGAEAQHFGAFGAFGALGSPVGPQSQITVSLLVRRGF